MLFHFDEPTVAACFLNNTLNHMIRHTHTHTHTHTGSGQRENCTAAEFLITDIVNQTNKRKQTVNYALQSLIFNSGL